MNIKEFAEMVASGVTPIVELSKGIEDCEGYPEAGMRGKIISAVNDVDDTTIVRIDFSEFDEFNKSFESANYYGGNGIANLTAREANQYKFVQEYYLDSTTDVEYYFKNVSRKSISLYSAFEASRTTGSYVEWLENKVCKNRDY